MTVLISRNGHGGCRCRFRGLLVPLAPLPLMRCGGRGWCVGRMGDYQIAPKPPRGRLWQVAADAAKVLGVPPAGGDGGNTSSAPCGAPSAVHTPVCTPRALASRRALGRPQGEGYFTPAGENTSSGATRHLPPRGKALGGAPFNTAPPRGKAIGGAPLEGKAWEVRR